MRGWFLGKCRDSARAMVDGIEVTDYGITLGCWRKICALIVAMELFDSSIVCVASSSIQGHIVSLILLSLSLLLGPLFPRSSSCDPTSVMVAVPCKVRRAVMRELQKLTKLPWYNVEGKQKYLIVICRLHVATIQTSYSRE